MSDKIMPQYLSRKAILYVRQSSPYQVMNNLESQKLQYAMVEILLANCLAHGRRQFVEVAANFFDQCRYVLEMLGQVYGHDAETRERGLKPEERLQFHQELSGPVMEQLHHWLEAQFAGRKTEPNSGLGKAITYLLRHWRLTPTLSRRRTVRLLSSAKCAALRNQHMAVP